MNDSELLINLAKKNHCKYCKNCGEGIWFNNIAPCIFDNEVEECLKQKLAKFELDRDKLEKDLI